MKIDAWVFDLATYVGPLDPAKFDPARASGQLHNYLDLWALAETLGYKGIFFSEHHFLYALSPSPNLLVAALAMRTRHLRLGVMGQILPMYPPYRVAEECGMLDHLSNGRLEIGVARGLGFADTDHVGMPREEMQPRFDEALDVLVLGLTQPRFSYSGKFFSCTDLAIVPRPLQQPMPPLWCPVRTPESAASIARRGIKACAGFDSVEHIAMLFDAYRRAADKHGQPSGPEQLAIRRHVFVHEDEDAAHTFARASMLAQADQLGGPDSPGGKFILSVPDVIAGTPRQVAEEIRRQCKATGAGHTLMMMTPHHSFEGMAASYELFGRGVIPLLS